MASLVSDTIENLFNGVSQQPDSLRAKNQCEAAQNCHFSLVEGMQKRPPAEHVAYLSAVSDPDAKIHIMQLSADETYIMRLTATSIEMWDTAGNPVPINAPYGVAYLNCTDPHTELACLTVGDYTWIVNKTVVVKMDRQRDDPMRVDIQFVSEVSEIPTSGGAYTDTPFYRVTVNGTNYDVNWTSGWTMAQYATAMHGLINAAIGGSYTVTLPTTDTVRIATTTVPQDLEVTGAGWDEIDDGSGTDGFLSENPDRLTISEAPQVAPTRVQDFAALPAVGAPGTEYEIVGDDSNAFDNYYVKDDGTLYVEAAYFGMRNYLDSTTMPHQLVKRADGSFQFSPGRWIARQAGDETSNPTPSFVGGSINDIFFHRNRLGLVSGANVVLSAAGDYYRFWYDTATDLRDDDPIDITASHTKSAIIRNSVSFTKTLLLFSDSTQFVLSGGDVLTPLNARLEATTEFDHDEFIKPVSSGQTVYFGVERTAFAGVREYYVDEDTLSNDAADVTAHVPRYIEGALYHMTASSQTDMLVCLSTTDVNTLYIYKYYWGKDQKIQSAWGKWDIVADGVAMSAFFVGEDLYCVVDMPDGLYLQKYDMQDGGVDANMTYRVLLDRKVLLTGVYDAGNDWTTFTLPYEHAQDDITVVLGPGWGTDAGRSYTATRPTTTTARVTGQDLSAFQCYVGADYTMRFTLSKQYVRDSKDVVSPSGSLRLLNMTALYEDTGYFRAEVTPAGRAIRTSIFAGVVLGVSQSTLGVPAISTGEYRFPVKTDADNVVIDIVNDKPVPSKIQSLEWEAKYHARARRL